MQTLIAFAPYGLGTLGALSLGLAGLRAYVPVLARRNFTPRRLAEQHTPAELGLHYETYGICTENGRRLFAWYVPAGPATPAPAVAVIHGWGANAERMLPYARLLHGAGYSALLLDARNHGSSDDDGFSSMVKFAEDLEHGVTWLAARPDVAPGRIAVLGHSLGAAAALLAGSRQPALRAVVSIAAFAHPRELLRRTLTQRRIPYWPVGKWTLQHLEQRIGQRYDDIAPVRTIGRIGCPVLLVHGGRDHRVPVTDADAIYAGRPSERVRLWVLPKGQHDAGPLIARHPQMLLDFLQRSLGGSR